MKFPHPTLLVSMVVCSCCHYCWQALVQSGNPGTTIVGKHRCNRGLLAPMVMTNIDTLGRPISFVLSFLSLSIHLSPPLSILPSPSLPLSLSLYLSPSLVLSSSPLSPMLVPSTFVSTFYNTGAYRCRKFCGDCKGCAIYIWHQQACDCLKWTGRVHQGTPIVHSTSGKNKQSQAEYCRIVEPLWSKTLRGIRGSPRATHLTNRDVLYV